MRFPQIIVALDQIELSDLSFKLNLIKNNFSWVKVGMELFYKGGLQTLEKIKKEGFDIFLDLKLHDIPETVFHTLKIVNQFPIDMINVHLTGGKQMCLRSREAITNTKIKLIGVSVLTSMDHIEHQEIFKSQLSIIEHIQSLAEIATQAQFDGIVCSALDLPYLNSSKDSLLKITPGIRLNPKENNDQKRISTPKLALKNGASFLVMGRELLQADDYYQFINSLGEHLNE